MTKGQMIELIKNRLGNDDRLGDRTVALNINTAWEQSLRNIFRYNPAALDMYAVEYKDVAVLHDESTDTYYSMLPVKIIQSINISNGVRRINAMKDRSLSFIPATGMMLDYLRELDVFHAIDSIPYDVRKDRVVYYGMNSDITKVKMDLVPPFNELDDDDEFPLPMGESQAIVSMVADFFKGTPWVDIRQRHTNIDTD